MSAVKATGLPFILVDEALQKGHHFGERYCDALEYCFSEGFEKIISVGTDCANLTTEVLLNAHLASLDNNLIGADNNGGFYLFALHSKNYSRQHFLVLRWCTAHLLKGVFSYFKNNDLAQPTLFQNGKDINSIIDLVKVLKARKASSFLKLLSQLFQQIDIVIYLPFQRIDNFSLQTSLFRGPPSMVAVSL